jgi:hypothetical protein
MEFMLRSEKLNLMEFMSLMREIEFIKIMSSR